MRTEQITYEGVLVTEECCKCGMTFAMPEIFYKKARRENAAVGRSLTFYCPAGHPQHYTGKNEEQALRDQLARERAARDQETARADEADRRRAAQKAATTRARKRHAAGVCPACKRSFANVRKHMESKHPDYDPAHANT